MKHRTTQEEGDGIREFFKRWPQFYYWAVCVLGPVLFVGLSPRGFLRKYPKEGIVLNVGSGPRILAPEVVNIDVVRYEGVSVIADATKLPFEEVSVARIVCDNVLEHVDQPEEALREFGRVLHMGGYLYIATPFVYPFHSSPSDHTRWTEVGLQKLLVRHGFSVVASGARGGPVAVLILWIAHMLASILCMGHRRIHTLWLNIFLIVLFPLKIIDILAAHLPFINDLNSLLYIVGVKIR